MRNIVATLKSQAAEIASEGHAGWGNTMQAAADRIEALEDWIRRWRTADAELVALDLFEEADELVPPLAGETPATE